MPSSLLHSMSCYVGTSRAVAFYNATILDEIIPVIIVVLYCILGIVASADRRSERYCKRQERPHNDSQLMVKPA